MEKTMKSIPIARQEDPEDDYLEIGIILFKAAHQAHPNLPPETTATQLSDLLPDSIRVDID